MRGHLNELEDKIFSEWTAHVPEQCVKNLEKPLMIQAKETLELSLNFDKKVVFIVYVRFIYMRVGILILATLL